MAVKTPRKRNPNDATFRNINALKARVTSLEKHVARLWATLAKGAK
jgi:hypothetical protein